MNRIRLNDFEFNIDYFSRMINRENNAIHMQADISTNAVSANDLLSLFNMEITNITIVNSEGIPIYVIDNILGTVRQIMDAVDEVRINTNIQINIVPQEPQPEEEVTENDEDLPEQL